MSGVNYALFAYVWMQSRYAPRSGYSVASSTTWLLMIWLVLCGTGMMGPVANAAHAFGLIFGLLIALPTYLRFRRAYRLPGRPEPGSWKDLNVQGFARVRRLYLEPYAPAWFVVVALLVVAMDYY
jgi:GlpG protein